jgi:hypothetical protein
MLIMPLLWEPLPEVLLRERPEERVLLVRRVLPEVLLRLRELLLSVYEEGSSSR